NPKLLMSVALWRFARVGAFAAKGNKDQARVEQKAFQAAAQKLPGDYMFSINPGPAIAKIAEEIIEAKVASSERAAIEHWKRAVEAQDALRYDEPPGWFYPVRESLGGALLRAGKAMEAEAVFRDDLRLNPRNGRSLFGLMKSLEAQKRTQDVSF